MQYFCDQIAYYNVHEQKKDYRKALPPGISPGGAGDILDIMYVGY
jgi:hypothetical protein